MKRKGRKHKGEGEYKYERNKREKQGETNKVRKSEKRLMHQNWVLYTDGMFGNKWCKHLCKTICSEQKLCFTGLEM